MVKKMLMLGVLLAASVCDAEPEMGQWEISMGANRVLTFQPEHIPYVNYYFALLAFPRSRRWQHGPRVLSNLAW